MNGNKYLDGVLEYLQEFATSQRVNANDVTVKFTLADGSSFTTSGLKTALPTAAQGLGMIQGTAGAGTALVIRESHVIKVEFQLEPDQRKPIGLHSEVG